MRTLRRLVNLPFLAVLLTAGAVVADVDERLNADSDGGDAYSDYAEYEQAAGAGVAGESSAVTDDDGGQGLDEITVTAQKRSQRLQDVPAAVTALSGTELEQSGATQIQDLAFQVPNFHFGQEEGEARITIRGVSSAEGSDQSTAFHVDGVYLNRPTVGSSLTFFDIQRVEVLRGPQGTLYGRNATGGAINVISAPPTNDFEMFGDVQVGNYYQILSRAALNIPIVQDRAAFRFSVFNESRQGFQKNEFIPGPIDDADDAQNWGLRMQLLLTPRDDLDITLRFVRSRKSGVGYALKYTGDFPPLVGIPIGGTGIVIPLPLYVGATPNSPDPRRISLDTAGEILYDRIGGNIDVQWRAPTMPLLGDTKLRVIGSYTEFDEFEIVDRDSSDNLIVNSTTNEFSREWVAEINWSSQNEADFDWIFGVFYLGTENGSTIDLSAWIPFGPFTFTPTAEQFFDRDSHSAAAFFRGTYHLTPNLRLEGGLRYSHDWKNSRKIVLPLFLLPGILPLAVPVDDQRSGDWGRVSGELGLNYKVDDDKLVYAKFSTGYKAGSLNNDIPVFGGIPATPTDNPVCSAGVCSYPDAEPEDLFAFELGSKNDFLDHRLRANLTGFVYYYNDLQVSQLFESGIFVENAASALIGGLELEVSGRPWRDLTLIGQFSYLYTEYLDFPMCTNIRSNTPEDCTGNQLTRAPTFSGTFIALYDFDLGRFGTFTPRFQVYGSDAVFFRPLNADIDKMDAYALLDFRFIWSHEDGRFGIEAFIMNALDQDVITTKIVGSALIGSPDYTAYDRPRTIGLRMSIAL